MFQGSTKLNLDAKGRLMVPARYRDALLTSVQGQLTVTKHPHGCLRIYTRPAWEQVRGELSALRGEGALWLKRMLLGHAMDVDMDASGRVLIPPELRSAALLDRECLLLGVGKCFELWDWGSYESQEKQHAQGEMLAAVSDFLE
ncbi:division/cell wall cluster transcriptional repressor MraZ [Candidatus Symbiobacter mobilis]|uniref:Transcriptional regulator MraZ n=1 Tax=Candidatus Symbiobacter mobilis CR TaxID=946483 RepID=U5N9Y1_9BURK|nr:division/cell wall cluster transcriptional repressor MraZ [Candidatus Symbiobacter mobilis]AGX86999.1 MraZ protein [Candidatus Symbiobacter mobilis CR]